MATENVLSRMARVTASDFTNKLYFAAALDANGLLVIAGAAVSALGVVYEEAVAGKAATIATAGIVKGSAGGAIDEGVPVTTDASGEFVAASAGQKYFGFYIGEGAAADGDIISILIDRGELET